MFRHNRYQPNIFDIIFINGSTIYTFHALRPYCSNKTSFYFVACYWFRRPKCSMLRAHYYFKDWYAAVRLQAELPTRTFYGRLSFRGKHLFHVSVRKRIYIPSEHDARRHFRTLSTQILVHFISTISHEYASQQTVLFLLFSSHLPQISEVFTNYFQGHDDEVVSKDGARVTLLSAIVLFVGLEFI